MGAEEFQELHEHAEHAAHDRSMAPVSMTMAVLAVLVAVVSLLGHRTHTEEVLIQTRANDQWAYYQAKTIRSHMYAADAEMATLFPKGDKLAEDFNKRFEEQKNEAETIRQQAEEKEKETEAVSRKANQFDTSEIFLEIAIVLCSIALLTRVRVFWLISFVSTIVGVAFCIRGFLVG